MVKKLSTILCQVAKVEDAASFYQEVLGMKPIYVSPGWGQFDLPGGGSIGLHPPFTDGKMPDGSGWILGLEVESVSALRTVLERAGRKVGAYHDVPGGVVIEFTDPDGNPIQAIQHGITAKDLA